LIGLADDLFQLYCGASLPMRPVLLDLGAAALDENNQYDESQNAGNNSDDRVGIHIDSSFLRHDA